MEYKNNVHITDSNITKHIEKNQQFNIDPKRLALQVRDCLYGVYELNNRLIEEYGDGSSIENDGTPADSAVIHRVFYGIPKTS